MSQIGYGGGPPKRNTDPDISGQTVFGRFVGLTRDMQGKISWGSQLTYGYVMRGDQLWTRATNKEPARVVPPEEASTIEREDVSYLQFQVLSPAEIRGIICPCSATVKGLYTWQDQDSGQWQFWIKTAIDPELKNDRLSGLVELCLACGVDGELLNPVSPFFAEVDPDTGETRGFQYIKDALPLLVPPLDAKQILVHVLVPKMEAASHAGHVVQFTVDPKNKTGGNWIKRATVKAVPSDRAETIMAECDDLLYPGTPTGAATGTDVAELKVQIVEAFQGGKITKQQIIGWAAELGVVFDGTGGSITDVIVAHAGARGLERILEKAGLRANPETLDKDMPI